MSPADRLSPSSMSTDAITDELARLSMTDEGDDETRYRVQRLTAELQRRDDDQRRDPTPTYAEGIARGRKEEGDRREHLRVSDVLHRDSDHIDTLHTMACAIRYALGHVQASSAQDAARTHITRACTALEQLRDQLRKDSETAAEAARD